MQRDSDKGEIVPARPSPATRIKSGRHRLIVIGDQSMLVRVSPALPAGCDVLTFRNVEEFDLWSRGQSPDSQTIHADVRCALAWSGTCVDQLPPALRDLVLKLARQTRTPTIAEWIGGVAARRSFYRLWRAHVTETPARFLSRVRALHGSRLVEGGMGPKEAALKAGYPSSAQLHRAVADKGAVRK